MEGELVGVEEVEVVVVVEEVVCLTDDWFARIHFVFQIQRNDLHMNRLSSIITKTEQSQIMYSLFSCDVIIFQN